MKHVILLGDSIRMGYQGEATGGLADAAYVWGPDVNCQTSANILVHLRPWVLDRPCDILHLNAGLHDLKIERRGEPVHQVPIDAYRETLRAIFRNLRAARPDLTIIWATTTPVVEKLHNAVRDVDRYEKDVADYNQTALAVAREFGLIVDDLHAVVRRSDMGRIMLNDGVHYTDAGYRILGREVAACIHPLLPDRE